MSLFRRFARRLWPLHAYLMVSMVLWPVPAARSYWTWDSSSGAKTEVANPTEGDSWFDQDSDGDNLTNAQEALFGSDPYARDSDRDGLSDLVERDYTPPSAPFDPWSWDTDGDGYSDHDEYYLLLQGRTLVVHYPSLGGIYYDYRDADGDGVLNYEDSDSVNMDRDGDGLRNWEDSWMDDASNGYVPPAYDPGVYIGGTWYPSGAMDSDNDGIPDHLDPFPWGSFWYNGIEYGGSWGDRDADGIPDSADTCPDGSYWYNGVEYGGMWSDMDGDQIPDPADPFPYSSTTWFNGVEYPWQDTDGDGIPNQADGWPNNRWNGMPYFTYNGIEYPGESVDRDRDGVPDAADSWPDDPENAADNDNDGLSNYDERTQHFTDPHDVDTDNDWLTDYEELYVFNTNPKAPRSGLASGQMLLDGQIHLGADADGDELPDVLEDHYASLGYGLDKNDPADGAGDLDSDGYTNAEAFTFGWNLIANSGTYDQDDDGIDDAVEDYWAAVYPGSMDKTVFEDAVADHDQDGLMNYEEVVRHNVNGWLLPADPGDPYSLMRTQGYEVVPGLTLNDGQFMRWWWDVNRLDYAWDSSDPPNPLPADSSLLDLMDTAPANGIPDGYERWDAEHPAGYNPPRAVFPDEDQDGMPNEWERRYQFNPRDFTDAGPDENLPALVVPVAPDSSDPVFLVDYGMGLFFSQEAFDRAMQEFQEDIVDYNNAIAWREKVDPDDDLVPNQAEFKVGTHPRVNDTDGDGFNDGVEIVYGTDPSLAGSVPPVVLNVVTGGSGTTILSGHTSVNALVVEVTQAGRPRSGIAVTFSSPLGNLRFGGAGSVTVTTGADGRTSVMPAAPATAAVGTANVEISAAGVVGTLAVPFQILPAGGGGTGGTGTGGSGGGPVDPPPTPPPAGHLFTSMRLRRVSYSGKQKLSYDKEVTYEGQGTLWHKPGPEPQTPGSDDGFNGDADLQGNNEDPGDPRDERSTPEVGWVEAEQNEEGAESFDGSIYKETPLGPYDEPGDYEGEYIAFNAYVPPDKSTAARDGAFDKSEALSRLSAVAYGRGGNDKGWQGNGPRGVTGYQVQSSLITTTENAPEITYMDSSNKKQTSTVEYKAMGAFMEQAEVRLETNTEVTAAELQAGRRADAFFVLQKMTQTSGNTTSTTVATLKLKITSGKQSNAQELLSGELPSEVTMQNGVISMRSPSPVSGSVVSYNLIPVDIEPDANMAGVVGDVVKSAKAGSTVEHFVTPKKSTDLNQDYVELKAVGVDTATFSQLLEWEGGEAGSSADKRKVKRDATGKTEVKIKTKQGGTVAAQMNVWVVWADGSAMQQGVGTFTRQADTTIDGTATTSAIWAMKPTEWKFKFTIQPASIITEQERPELSGAKQSPPPGGNSEFSGKPLAGGADKKWDVSRRCQYRVVNPDLKPKGKFSSGFGTMFDGQPQADSFAFKFPTDPVVGNDDSGFTDEENDPYSAATGAIAHGIGEISSVDGPTIWMPEAGSSNGHTLEVHDLFGEFARLNVGSKWYNISSFVDWKAVAKFSMQNNQWTNGGCSTSTGN